MIANVCAQIVYSIALWFKDDKYKPEAIYSGGKQSTGSRLADRECWRRHRRNPRTLENYARIYACFSSICLTIRKYKFLLVINCFLPF